MALAIHILTLLLVSTTTLADDVTITAVIDFGSTAITKLNQTRNACNDVAYALIALFKGGGLTINSGSMENIAQETPDNKKAIHAELINKATALVDAKPDCDGDVKLKIDEISELFRNRAKLRLNPEDSDNDLDFDRIHYHTDDDNVYMKEVIEQAERQFIREVLLASETIKFETFTLIAVQTNGKGATPTSLSLDTAHIKDKEVKIIPHPPLDKLYNGWLEFKAYHSSVSYAMSETLPVDKCCDTTPIIKWELDAQMTFKYTHVVWQDWSGVSDYEKNLGADKLYDITAELKFYEKLSHLKVVVKSRDKPMEKKKRYKVLV